MMSTLSRTRSWARALRRWGWPSAHRYSIATVWPSIQPRSRRPRRNANELLVVCCCGVLVAEKTNPGDCALLRVEGWEVHQHRRWPIAVVQFRRHDEYVTTLDNL